MTPRTTSLANQPLAAAARSWPWLAAIALLLAATTVMADAGAAVEPAEETRPMPNRPPVSSAAQRAIEDLASRLAIDAHRIELVRAEEVDWPDTSLGCPRPGMRYLQKLVNGTFVQLRVGERLFNYHGAGVRAPMLCTSKDERLPEDLRTGPPGTDRRL